MIDRDQQSLRDNISINQSLYFLPGLCNKQLLQGPLMGGTVKSNIRVEVAE